MLLLAILKRHCLSATAAIPANHPDAARSRRKAILLVFSCTILGAAAQLLMKVGMSHFAPTVASILTNVPLIAGYVLYGINTLMLVLALREGELSMLYPIIALTYVWVTLLSYMLLNEPENLYKNLGIATIVIGVAVLGRGGKK
jgi:multidrug transporter EmrE-like cation transporter